jgi:hypothetical protein
LTHVDLLAHNTLNFEGAMDNATDWSHNSEDHEKQQLLRDARLTLAQKLQWLEEAHKMVLQLQKTQKPASSTRLRSTTDDQSKGRKGLDTQMKVAIIGATGIAGQQFLAALPRHPDLKLQYSQPQRVRRARPTSMLCASLRVPSAGGATKNCQMSTHRMPVVNADEFDATTVDIVFTAVESDAAKSLEPRYAQTTPVISTASAFRYENDVPILIPGVNNDHAQLLKKQQQERGWKGFVTPIPNCTTTGLAMTLKPIYDNFGVKSVVMTSMQAMSGAGRRGGVLGLDAVRT